VGPLWWIRERRRRLSYYVPIACWIAGYAVPGSALECHQPRCEFQVHREKGDVKPWQRRQWCLSKVDAKFIYHMEDVLDLYEEPYNPLMAVANNRPSGRGAAFRCGGPGAKLHGAASTVNQASEPEKFTCDGYS
jgi:hypothetical protein